MPSVLTWSFESHAESYFEDRTRAAGSGCLNATAALRARRFVSDFLLVASKNCGDREEAKSHNACAKSDNKERKKEFKKECHSSE